MEGERIEETEETHCRRRGAGFERETHLAACQWDVSGL